MVSGECYLPAARRCQRVAFNIFLCFFLRMRLRRFLINDPMSTGTLADQVVLRHVGREGVRSRTSPVSRQRAGFRARRRRPRARLPEEG